MKQPYEKNHNLLSCIRGLGRIIEYFNMCSFLIHVVGYFQVYKSIFKYSLSFDIQFSLLLTGHYFERSSHRSASNSGKDIAQYVPFYAISDWQAYSGKDDK